MKKAIISGVTGQDGFFLKKLLEKKNYSNAFIAHQKKFKKLLWPQ